jgi:hypothetical protein
LLAHLQELCGSNVFVLYRVRTGDSSSKDEIKFYKIVVMLLFHIYEISLGSLCIAPDIKYQ